MSMITSVQCHVMLKLAGAANKYYFPGYRRFLQKRIQ